VHLCMKKVERWQGSFARINVTDAWNRKYAPIYPSPS
jgi:hypothetical protein